MDKYIGKEVGVDEVVTEYKGKKYSHFEVKKDDPIVLEIEKEHSASNAPRSIVRWWTPGMAGTMDYNPARLNVHVEKAPDGVYRITNVGNG